MPGELGSAEATLVHHRPRFSEAKFAPPDGAEAGVKRPRLLGMLDRGHHTGLVLVIGSAGSGKTRLLRQWVATRAPNEVCWLNVDDADVSPVRFWHGVVESVGTTRDGFGRETLELIARDAAIGHDVVECLATELARTDGTVTLVVDDLHLARGGVDRTLDLLVARRPPNLVLMIGSRSEPSLGLGRLRASDRVVEVRDRDLLLDEPEAGDLLVRLGVTLTPESVRLLWERTEGWAAGVHLAGVALEKSADPAAFLDRLVASSEAIAHYLSTQVLATQPPEVVRFLLDTCVVDELTPELAAVLSVDSTVSLHDVEAANLMLFRSAADPQLFRYHHLVLQMLRLRLAATDPERERRLHRAAAGWYDSKGDLAATFRHRWRADDRDGAMQLLTANLFGAYISDRLPEMSPSDVVLTDTDIQRAPGPAIGVATMLFLREHQREADRLAYRVQHLLGDRLAGIDRAQLASLRAFISTGDCDMEATVELATEVRRFVERTGTMDDSLEAAMSMLVRAHAWRGEWSAAEAAAQLVPIGGRPTIGTIEMTGALATVDLFRGRLGSGIARARHHLDLFAASNTDQWSLASMGHALLGWGLLERGDVESGETLLHRAVDPGESLRLPSRIMASVGLARLHLARGEVDQALDMLESARARLRHLSDSSAVVAFVNAAAAKLRSGAGDHEEATRLADSLPDGVARDLTSARVRLAGGDLAGADDCLRRAADRADSERTELEVALVRLDLGLATGASTDAMADAVLAIAGRDGFVFMLAEEGGDVFHAIQQSARRAIRTDFVATVLRTRPHVGAGERTDLRAETLSDRELAVLRYLATSMSYREIAGELYVSVNTLKSHVKNTFRKLGASSRDDALARARDAGYL